MDRILNRRPRSGPSTLAFHVSRIVVDGGVLVVLAAMSMPFVTTEGADKSSVAADALPVLILLAPVFLLTLIPDHSLPMPAPIGWASLALAVTSFPFAVVKYLDAANLADTLAGDVGFGARLLVLGNFVTIVGLALGLIRISPDDPRRPKPARPRAPRGARTAAPRSRPAQGGRAARTPPSGTSSPAPRTTPAPARHGTGDNPRPRPDRAPAPSPGGEPTARREEGHPTRQAPGIPPGHRDRPPDGDG